MCFLLFSFPPTGSPSLCSHVPLPAITSSRPSHEIWEQDFKQGLYWSWIVFPFATCSPFTPSPYSSIPFSPVSLLSSSFVSHSFPLFRRHTTSLPHWSFFSCFLYLSAPPLPPHPLYLCWLDKGQGHSIHFMYLLTQRSVWELNCLSPSVSFGVYSTGCLLVYSLIKGLPDSPNQIILYKQKDLLQLFIDFLLSSLLHGLLWLLK